MPEVPAPVVPPPVPLPLSLLPPPLLERVRAEPVLVEFGLFVLLGLLLVTQSARAVPVRPAQDALGVVLLSRKQSDNAVPVMPAHAPAAVPVVPVAVDDGEVDGVADIPDVPVALDDGEVDGVADIPDVPVAVDDGEVDGVADVPDVVDCANTAPLAARDVATMSVFNFHNFIEPPEERKNYKDRKRS